MHCSGKVACALILAALSLCIRAGAQDDIGEEMVEPDAPTVLVVPIEGMIDDGIAVFVSRAVARADENTEAIIFAIDTPGGRVDSCLEVVRIIQQAPVRTIAYIDGMGAISAGAIISYACDHLVMSSWANMGAAAPVVFTTAGMEPLGEKEVSFLRARIATIAQAQGHNPDIAMAMVDSDIELRAYPGDDGTWLIRAVSRGVGGQASETPAPRPVAANPMEDAIRRLVEEVTGQRAPHPRPEEEVEPPAAGGPGVAEDGAEVIVQAGKLLTLTPDQALRYGVVEAIRDSLDETLVYFGYEDYVIEYLEMTWSEKLFRWLTSPTISALLLLIGAGGLYYEVRTPGFGIPGIIGIASLALFFGARTIVGLSDWVDILLVTIGVVLLLAEIFVIPGFGVAGVAGIICILTGLYLSFQFGDFTIPEYEWEWARLHDFMYAMTLTLVGFVIFSVATWKLMPHTPLRNMLVLGHSQEIDAGYTVQSAEESTTSIGRTGVATTMLRPAGRGRFEGKTVRVVTRGEYIPKDTPIRIIAADGNRYVVDRIAGQGEES